MTKKYKVILIVLSVITISVLGANIAWMSGKNPGSSDNPLVSKGYLDKVLAEFKSDYKSDLRALEQEIAQLKDIVNNLKANEGNPSQPSQPTQPSQPQPSPPTTGERATIVVDSSVVNFRSGSNTSASIIARVNSGDEIIALNYRDQWIEGIYNNQRGWIASWLVKNKPNHNLAYVSASLINVRGGAGTNHPVVTQLNHGVIVRILSEQNGWARVILPDGREGWIHRPLLTSL